MLNIRAGIQTKFIGPTNTKGDRVKASSQAGSLTVSWDYSLDSTANHLAAAQALSDKLNWGPIKAGGSLPNGQGYLFATTVLDD